MDLISRDIVVKKKIKAFPSIQNRPARQMLRKPTVAAPWSEQDPILSCRKLNYHVFETKQHHSILCAYSTLILY